MTHLRLVPQPPKLPKPQVNLNIRDARNQLITAQLLFLETGDKVYSDECLRLVNILESLGAVNINKREN